MGKSSKWYEDSNYIEHTFNRKRKAETPLRDKCEVTLKRLTRSNSVGLKTLTEAPTVRDQPLLSSEDKRSVEQNRKEGRPKQIVEVVIDVKRGSTGVEQTEPSTFVELNKSLLSSSNPVASYKKIVKVTNGPKAPARVKFQSTVSPDRLFREESVFAAVEDTDEDESSSDVNLHTSQTNKYVLRSIPTALGHELYRPHRSVHDVFITIWTSDFPKPIDIKKIHHHRHTYLAEYDSKQFSSIKKKKEKYIIRPRHAIFDGLPLPFEPLAIEKFSPDMIPIEPVEKVPYYPVY